MTHLQFLRDIMLSRTWAIYYRGKRVTDRNSIIQGENLIYITPTPSMSSVITVKSLCLTMNWP